ncbi:hypothetical protein SeMB42_g03672 [Synchytrium endobioticum]|uniref:Uncharacterized protein n=1 Tax=Synchytrium endobioticum TaxID=286115 RepID=A0A507D5D3_9FUNG|nr:hypothetical protein SeMB42_g03672 [Synchytrium endobioticum]
MKSASFYALAILASIVTCGFGSNCPLSKRCPYVDQHHSVKSDVAGCPLNGKCPYYDHTTPTVEGILTTKDQHCPLAGKCAFYERAKNDTLGEVNMNSENCPFAGSCPYYTEFKEHGGTFACPVMAKSCPHYQKVHKKPHHAYIEAEHKHHSVACPYMKAHGKDSISKLLFTHFYRNKRVTR